MPGRYLLSVSPSTRPARLCAHSPLAGIAMLAAFALAAFALAALFATAASAEGTLLASWLWNGSPVVELLSTEIHGSITMEDTKTLAGAASVLCTVTADGSVGANGEAETTEILNAASEKVGTALGGLALLGTGAGSGEGSECKTVKTCAEGTSASPIEVIPLGLPWHSLLFQHETTGTFLLLIFTEGELGYELLCLVLGINAEDKCTSTTKDYEIEVANEEEDAAIPASAQTEPLASCSMGGAATGHNIMDELAFIKPLEGLLSVSAEGGGAEPTTLSTTLSGEGKEGETITVLEGSKVKDKATLKGKNASTATGKVAYKVYSDSSCKTLVANAGEVTVSGESVPASSEEELTAGASYYWQAHYSGDSKNSESTSECTEISSVKAKTSLSTNLSGEGKEGKEITILDGADAKDTATLSGTNSSTAGGKVLYKVYSDNKCEHLVTEAGEVAVSSGSVPASNEEELEGGSSYYWQAAYGGDSLHQASESTCGTTVLNVKSLMCTLPYCEPTITPGVRVKIPVGSVIKECTAGPMMTKGTERFLLTAGHCIRNTSSGTETIVQTVQSAYPKNVTEQKEIGKSVTFNFTKNYDIAEVKVENAAEWLLAGGGAPPLLVEWKATPTVTRVVGQAENNVNERTCTTGASSGATICGLVLKLGATSGGIENLVETSAAGIGGDSGAPAFAPSTGGVLIQGVVVAAGALASVGTGDLTSGSKMITGYPGGTICGRIATWKTMWPTVPVSGSGIPADATVEECTEAGGSATITMSATAQLTGESEITIGYVGLGWYEPMSQIEAVYPGQALVMK